MRTLSLVASLGLAVSLFSQDPGQELPSPKAAMAEFLRANGDTWITQWCAATGTPSAIYGPGLELQNWNENTLEHARQHALQLLKDQSDLLGLGTSTFREVCSGRMGRTWSFVFDQFFRGLPVIEGRADVRINMNGRVAMLGSRAWPIPANFNVTPVIAEQVAVANAWLALGETPTEVKQPVAARAPQLVIWGDINAPALAPFYLSWEVQVSNIDRNGNGRIGRCYIDALTGAMLHYQNDKHDCGIPGCTLGTHGRAPIAVPATSTPPIQTVVTLMAWTRSDDDGYSALNNIPLRGIVLNVPGIGARTTDANGQFTIDIAAPVNITVGALDGTHFNPISGSLPPSALVTVNPGVNTTIQLLTSASTGNEAAHTNCAHFIDKANEWARTIVGNTSQMATASLISPFVNVTGTCNAFYSGNTVNYYSEGGGCPNLAFSTVIEHEWGHGLDDRYGGISNATGDGLSEGWGDIIGMYIEDTVLLGSGFQTPGVALRRGDNTRMYPQTGAEVHTAGQVWMGFAWRYREALRGAFGTAQAVLISNDTVIGSIIADATDQVGAVREVFIADDDDANLLNGTPHYAQLSSAAIQKNLPYPQIQVISIVHSPLPNTTARLTPRIVNCTASLVSGGAITAIRLVYNAGAGTVIRNMHPNGGLDGYRAMLPGQLSGSVTYHIEAVHNGTTTVRLPASGEYSYTTSAPSSGPFVSFHLQDFDSGAAGWTSAQVLTQNDWQIGDPAGKFGTSGGVAWADPQTAVSGLNCYGNDLGNTIGTQTWNGSYAANVENYLRSPVINCTGRFGVHLRFSRWLTVEEGIYDQARILVNGIQVWANPLNGHLVDTAWQVVEYPLPMADNNASVTVEFRLRSDASLQLGGWNIDNFELGTKTVTPLEAELRMLPEQIVQGGTLNLSVQTGTNSRPFLLGLGDTGGPLLIPGIPVMLVGGNLAIFSGTTDGAGSSVSSFVAPNTPSAVGLTYYSQVLTFNAAFTAWAVSNQHINFITQTL